jgi:APA family basic amino acid/polyamine antiporter
VITLYVLVNYACLRVLGADGLAATETPASAVMRAALGPRGATFIALGIAISTLGFLSQSMLTAPRVYFAMAEDGLFFRAVARLDSRTRAPVVAIALQGALAAVIAASGKLRADTQLRRLGRLHLVRANGRLALRLPQTTETG